MKNNRKALKGMLLIAVLCIMTACGNSTDESTASDNPPPNNNSAPNTNDDDSLDTDASNTDSTDTDTSTDTVSLREEYLEKLKDTKKEMDEMQENPVDDTTYAMKKVEGDRFDVWDGLLNEVYGVLEEQLSPEEMEQLREEQREWITYRDETAKEASLKYEGGTMEQLEYVMVQNNLTEERCFELVEDYMK
ncbi:DUF1311 domain-containing protein [Neobacillus mesonae]|nr:DUF1311 domain-containing protein [Neobacillus mesonae]